MGYTLFIADFAYSSWSLRGWLLFDAFGIARRLRRAHMRSPEFEVLCEEMAPARLVPAMQIEGDGEPLMVWDSLAMAETLAERHHRAALWPGSPARRATARSVAAEVHSGFVALRGACPMNQRRTWKGFQPDSAVCEDLARLEALWSYVKLRHGLGGPYLMGARFTAADAFLAPIASRIVTYDLPVGSGIAEYVAALTLHPAFRRWRSMAFADLHVQPQYEFDLKARPDPCAPGRTGRPVEAVGAENAACPFSGKPVAPDSLVEIQGRVIGFCNPFCRDKAAADPDAWPEVAALLGS